MNDNMAVLYELDETFKGGYSKTNTFYGDWNMLQYKGNYILVKGGTGADDIKIIDAMGNNILWGITKICSDNIAVRGNPFSGRCVFYNIEQKEPIFSIEQSEF